MNMIGKAKVNKNLFTTIKYNDKAGGRLICKNQLYGDNVQNCYLEMKELQDCYPGRATAKTLHVILSPSIHDSMSLEDGSWAKLAQLYLEKMKLAEHQALSFLHVDRDHRHLHLVVNMINGDSLALYKSSFIGKKTQDTAAQIANETGLVNANDKKMNVLIQQSQRNVETEGVTNAKDMVLGVKAKMQADIKVILDKNPASLEIYFDLLRKDGYEIQLYKQKNSDEIRGYSLLKYGTKMDASAISRNCTIVSLKKKISNNVNDYKENSSLSANLNESKSSIISDSRYIRQVLELAKMMEPQNVDQFFDLLSYFGLYVKMAVNSSTNSPRGYSISLDGNKYYNSSAFGIKFNFQNLKLTDNIIRKQKEYKPNKLLVFKPDDLKLLTIYRKQEFKDWWKDLNCFPAMNPDGLYTVVDKNEVEMHQHQKYVNILNSVKEFIQIQQKSFNTAIVPLTDIYKIQRLKNIFKRSGIAEDNLDDERISYVQKGTQYFIAFANDKKGYHLVNTFKSEYIGEASISTIMNRPEKVYSFVNNFFQYLKMKEQNNSTRNFIILNASHCNQLKNEQDLSKLKEEIHRTLAYVVKSGKKGLKGLKTEYGIEIVYRKKTNEYVVDIGGCLIEGIGQKILNQIYLQRKNDNDTDSRKLYIKRKSKSSKFKKSTQSNLFHEYEEQTMNTGHWVSDDETDLMSPKLM